MKIVWGVVQEESPTSYMETYVHDHEFEGLSFSEAYDLCTAYVQKDFERRVKPQINSFWGFTRALREANKRFEKET